MTIARSLVWQRTDGGEWCDLRLGTDQLAATGVQIGTTPVPYRVDYRLETAPGFVTTSIRVRSVGAGWQRLLALRRFPDGAWDVDASDFGIGPANRPGCDPMSLTGAVDIDLGLSPLTNTLPIRRLGLLAAPIDEPTTIIAAWISVPDLAVRTPEQTYTALGSGAMRYASGAFTADLELDSEGVVTNYPQLGRLTGDQAALD